MITILFDILVFCLIYIQYRKEKNWINMISVLMAPYAIFATLNNFIFVNLGFYKISNQTLLMLGISFILFFAGGFLFNRRVKQKNDEKNNLKILEKYDINNMAKLLFIIGCIGFIKLIIMVISGDFSFGNINNAEGVLGSGIFGHLLLLSYSITPIVFLAAIEIKDKRLLIPVIMIAVITFFSLIKNNIIGLITSLFLFIAYYKKSLVKKIIFIFAIAVIVVFVGNYLLTFSINKMEAPPAFYLNQFWVYCSGSMINNNRIFIEGIRVDTDLFYKLMTAVMGLPNMFISAFSGKTFFPFQTLTEMQIGTAPGQTSNVIDSFGYFFPSKGSGFDLIIYGIFILLVGFIFSLIYYKSRCEKRGFNVFICNFLTYFVAFSFFGTFYIFSAPWEILIYSLIIPYLFYKSKSRINLNSLKQLIYNNSKKRRNITMEKKKMIQYSVWKNETNNASGKAKNDAFDISESMGFSPSYHPSNKRFIRVLQQILSMWKIRRADVLFVQYPAIDDRIQKLLYRNINKKGISIALVHDLPSIQGMKNGDKEREIQQLQHFTHLIVHNSSMKSYLKELGYKGKMICLELFDYLHDENRNIDDSSFRKSAFVAGNLKKGQYILQLDKVSKCNFDLFGLKGDMDFSKMKNVDYKGMLPSDEIVYKVTGDYGLVWDGDSLEGCTGVYGKYLKYNNPHKLSLCMAAGKPVIVWKKSAVAKFVEKEKVGICVDSLEELNTIDLQSNYAQLKKNAMKLKYRVAQGFYLKRALKKILDKEE